MTNNQICKLLARHDIGLHREVVRRYTAGERPVPFLVGWRVLHAAGQVGPTPPNLRAVLSGLRNTYTLSAIGDAIGVDQDTVGCYASGKRKRILWDTGVKIIRLAGLSI